MPTKTDRILSYLPGTFQALPRPTALYSIVDAFGNELLHAENSLAAVMLAHWVDHADRGAELINDLACFAALYGLAPRDTTPVGGVPAPDNGVLPPKTCPPVASSEGIEEFRAHLKHYVRTFLEGTVTVQGILRIVAEVLGLSIADDYAAMDTWWTRDGAHSWPGTPRPLVTTAPRGDDAAALLFGADTISVSGRAARPARVAGTPDLSGGIDLRGGSILHLALDGVAPVDVDIAAHITDPSAAKLDDIVKAINGVLNASVASAEGPHLVLASPTVGPASRLEVRDGAGDAAPRLLGLLPRSYQGSAATAAQVTGTIDLSGGVDLSEERYLRLLIDGVHLAEVDCHGTDSRHTTLEEVKNVINTALGPDIAAHDGHYLTLTSPTIGGASSIAFQQPAAQDATARLFGSIPTYSSGQDARSATVTGTPDLSAGVDLSARSQIRVSIDGRAAVTVTCAGADPANTIPSEIVAILNAILGAGSAGHDGRHVRLNSLTAGPTSSLAFEQLAADIDATELIFGIGPRVFEGAASSAAQVTGTPDLHAGVDLSARHVILVALDGGAPREIDLQQGIDDYRAVSPQKLVDALASLGHGVATTDGTHLTLTSPTTGAASRVSIGPLEETRRRLFVSRAFVPDAAEAILGVAAQPVPDAANAGRIPGGLLGAGAPATAARVVGVTDLSRGVDLRTTRYLRLGLDGRPPIDVDCAAFSTRPRTAMPNEIEQAINKAIKDAFGSHLPDVASDDGTHLVLTSLTVGGGSHIAFEPSRAADALERVLGLEPGTVRGSDATSVRFVGTVDLSGGVDLSAVNHVTIGVDGAAPVEIECAGNTPAHTTLDELVVKINVALKATIAGQDGVHLILTSPTSGHGSEITFATPSSADATQAIFGIAAPRTYHGADATPARIEGRQDLSGGADLHVAHFLNIALDGHAPTVVDLTSGLADPAHTALHDIVVAINQAVAPTVASDDGTHLILTSTTMGRLSRIDLLPSSNGDARIALLGGPPDVPDVTAGSDPTPATITGTIDLLAPVDLAEARTLRLAVDGGRPVDVDVAGAVPETTSLTEIIASINGVFPGMAAATPDDRLVLTSPTAGEESRLEVQPIRALELIEYPAQTVDDPPQNRLPGDSWTVTNSGIAAANLRIKLRAPHGVCGPELVNRTSGQRVRLMTVLNTGEEATMWRDIDGRLRATVKAADEWPPRVVPPSRILAGPLGPQVRVPFSGERYLRRGAPGSAPELQLNDSLAPAVVVLRTLDPADDSIKVDVTPARLEATVSPPAVADGQTVRLSGQVRPDGATGAPGHLLVDRNGATIARLREGPGIQLDHYNNRIVTIRGAFYREETTPLLVVDRVVDLFDVTLHGHLADGSELNEAYASVTLGQGTDLPEDLTMQITTRPSKLVRAMPADKTGALVLPCGESAWTYLDCDAARFDQAAFNHARFPDGACTEVGVFDIARFADPASGLEEAVFAPSSATPAEVSFHWSSYQPGAFEVNLPAELPEAFGARFNQARFALPSGETAETYSDVFIEVAPGIDPTTDNDHLVKRINDGSALVTAAVVGRAPIGWQLQTVPFYHSRLRNLTGGTDRQAAALYLRESEDGVETIVALTAREVGAWGNDIAMSVRRSGPVRFEVTISYQGARFENARQAAMGGQLAVLTEDLLQAQSIGVVQAKAAGVQASVTRDRAVVSQTVLGG